MYKNYIQNTIISIVIIVISTLIFHQLYNFSDLKLHADFAAQYINGASLPSNFLYYYIISLIALFNPENLKIATILVLSLSVLFKYYVTFHILSNSLPDNIVKKNSTAIKLISLALIFSFSLLFPQVLIHKMYHASFPHNVWHNSTIIFVMPFALLLMWNTIKFTNAFNLKRLITVLILIGINATIKPSYLFVYICVFPLILILQKKGIKNIIKTSIPMVFALFCILALKYAIYDSETNATNIIAIKPFFVYKVWLNNSAWYLPFFVLTVISCYAFPIWYSIRNKVNINNTLHLHSLISMAIAFAIFILIAEIGDRTTDGNFTWQIIIVGYMFFLSTLVKVLPTMLEKPLRFNIYTLLLSMHTITGIIYISHVLINSTYK